MRIEEALWEIEWKVREIAAEQTGIRFDLIGPESRMIEDLHMDSLVVVEFVLALEDAFGISIPDDESRRFFTANPETIRTVALAVQRWPKATTGRVFQAPQELDAEEMPFTQLGPSAEPSSQPEKYLALGANREGFLEYRRRRDGMRCILIPAGEARLGDPAAARETAIDEFLLDAEPVSNTAYARFLNFVAAPADRVLEWCGCEADDARASQFPLMRGSKGWTAAPGTERQPMILVSWFGANAYSRWANERDWQEYREAGCLPSEAQWEYAARGEGDQATSCPVVARHVPSVSYEADTLPAVSVSLRRGVSPFGALHMGGNVWQWCRDWYADGLRSERGGSWVGPAELALPWYRRGRAPEARGRCLGFRCRGTLDGA